MEVIGFILILLLVIAFGMLCYFKWELSGINDNLKIFELHQEIVDCYEKRIEIMKNLIDYNDNIVNRVIDMWNGKAYKNGISYLKDCYVLWDNIDFNVDDECICRDEHAYNDIWWDD